MVKKVVWTREAQDERQRMFDYWTSHNKSTFYSIKLNDLIKKHLKLACKYPQIGRATSFANVRMLIIKNYLLFYKIAEFQLVVITIWDSNQDQANLKL